MTERRILGAPDLARLEDQATRDNVRDLAVEYLPNLLATVRYWQSMADYVVTARVETQVAAEAIRRAEGAEERSEALREALRALVADETTCNALSCRLCADVNRARALLEES